MRIIKSKWIIGLLASIFFVLTVGQPVATNAASSRAVVSVSSGYDEKARSPFELAIFIQGATKLAGGVIQLEFNEDVMEIESISTGSVLQKDNFLVFDNLSSENREPGTVRITFASARGVDGNGVLVSPKVKVKRSGGETPISIKEIQLFNENLQEINTKVINGKIGAFNGKVQKKEKAVKSDKQWKVSFNIPIEESTLTNQTIFVQNTRSKERVPVSLEISNDRKTLTVKPPSSGYSRGDYALYILRNAHSEKAVQLKTAVKMEFKVE